MEYLVSKYAPKLAPPASDEDATLRFKYWLHFAEGSAMLPVLLDLLFSMTVTKAPFFIRPIASMISSGVHRFYSKLPSSSARTAAQVTLPFPDMHSVWFSRSTDVLQSSMSTSDESLGGSQ